LEYSCGREHSFIALTRRSDLKKNAGELLWSLKGLG